MGREEAKTCDARKETRVQDGFAKASLSERKSVLLLQGERKRLHVNTTLMIIVDGTRKRRKYPCSCCLHGDIPISDALRVCILVPQLQSLGLDLLHLLAQDLDRLR